MRLEIITHCWASHHKHFAQLLRYQLSSLILDQPRTCHVTCNVCYDPQDARTCNVLMWFLGYHYQHRKSLTRTNLLLSPMPLEELGRRCIGRNHAAKETKADVVWFTDCDHVFRDGVIDRLASLDWPDAAVMIYPKAIQISRDHQTGNNTANRAGDGIAELKPVGFVTKTYNRAIGGVQIVPGDFAREHGYLDGDPKWQQPTDTPFGDFRDDIAYRKHCSEHGTVAGVDLPGVYRIRHLTTTYQ